jgi:hypothetical protein
MTRLSVAMWHDNGDQATAGMMVGPMAAPLVEKDEALVTQQ